MSQELPPEDEILFLRYLRRRRFYILLAATITFASLATAAYLSIPKLLDRRATRASVTSADLEASKTRLKKSQRERLQKSVRNDEVSLPKLEPNPSIRAKLGFKGFVADVKIDDIVLPERVIQPQSHELAAKNAAVDATIEGYRSAKSPEEKSAYVVDPRRVLPLMRRFHAREADNLDLTGNLVRRTYYKLKGNEYAIDQRKLDNGSNRPIYVALRATGKNGEFKIDWESLVGYGELSWDELLSLRPEKPVLFRCYALRDNYHNFGYSDPTRWSCIQLINHQSGETIYGYVRKGTRADEKIFRALKARSPATLTLRLSFPSNIEAGHRQVRIDEVVQSTWLVVE